MTFETGNRVRTRPVRPEGHTRLPAYLSGKPGFIVRPLGAFPFPDDRAGKPGSGRNSPLYTVAFESSHLWPGNESGLVCADIFEDYLESDEPHA